MSNAEIPGGGRFANAVAKRIVYHIQQRDDLAKRCKKLEKIITQLGYWAEDFRECTYCDNMYKHDDYTGWCCCTKKGAHKFWCQDGCCHPYDEDGRWDAKFCKQCKGPTCRDCLVQCTVCPISPHCSDCNECVADLVKA